MLGELHRRLVHTVLSGMFPSARSTSAPHWFIGSSEEFVGARELISSLVPDSCRIKRRTRRPLPWAARRSPRANELRRHV
jgi:hypothetical protein